MSSAAGTLRAGRVRPTGRTGHPRPPGLIPARSRPGPHVRQRLRGAAAGPITGAAAGTTPPPPVHPEQRRQPERQEESPAPPPGVPRAGAAGRRPGSGFRGSRNGVADIRADGEASYPIPGDHTCAPARTRLSQEPRHPAHTGRQPRALHRTTHQTAAVTRTVPPRHPRHRRTRGRWRAHPRPPVDEAHNRSQWRAARTGLSRAAMIGDRAKSLAEDEPGFGSW
jgi:hypothetical protein